MSKIDIEKERSEFNKNLRDAFGVNEKQLSIGDFKPIVDIRWGGWLAAKRAWLNELEKLREDAENYRWLLTKACVIEGKGFQIINLPPVPDEWNRGSIAYHFDEAISKARKG